MLKCINFKNLIKFIKMERMEKKLIELSKIISSYIDYGFTKEDYEAPNILVFSIQSGHFYNAEIVVLQNALEEDIEEIKSDLSNQGFAYQVKKYKNIEEVKTNLFNGFFSVKSSKIKLKKSYDHHIKNIVNSIPTGVNYKYSYIKSKYYINNEESNLGVINEIEKRLFDPNPILFIIEAAAGFGKTCTAYELLNCILNKNDSNTLPFFSELSKNRQAKIFKYILLDEIDRNFPNLRSDLVIKKIKTGNVPIILDGFDELIDEKKDSEDWNQNQNISESMLSTISDLLIDKAKIILTTRRTAIFDSSEFNQWVDENGKNFQIFRIKISEPTIEEWLSPTRVKSLQTDSQSLLHLKNPVLLSYLNALDDESFSKIVAQPKLIVEKYFSSMLEREKSRQDLKMELVEQEFILEKIAGLLSDSGKISIKKEYLIQFLEECFIDLADAIQDRYIGENKPTFDQLVNKFANHALLDGFDNNQNLNITFVNEFVLGYFVSKHILNNQEWFSDPLFIEPAIYSTISFSEDEKIKLWSNIKLALEIIEDQNILVTANIYLNNEITIDLIGDYVSNMSFDNLKIGNHLVSRYGFVDCIFKSCNFNLKKMNSVTFTNCIFYSCTYEGKINSIYEYGCTSNNEDNFLEFINFSKKEEVIFSDQSNDFDEVDKFILERFWPMGRKSAHLHRHNNTFMKPSKLFTNEQLERSFKKLKDKEILVVPNKEDFSALNYEHITEIKQILGRD